MMMMMMCVYIVIEPVGEAVSDCTVHQKHTSPGDHVPVSTHLHNNTLSFSLNGAPCIYIWISSMSKNFRQSGIVFTDLIISA